MHAFILCPVSLNHPCAKSLSSRTFFLPVTNQSIPCIGEKMLGMHNVLYESCTYLRMQMWKPGRVRLLFPYSEVSLFRRLTFRAISHGTCYFGWELVPSSVPSSGSLSSLKGQFVFVLGLYMVWWTLFLLLLDCSAWLAGSCLIKYVKQHFIPGPVHVLVMQQKKCLHGLLCIILPPPTALRFAFIVALKSNCGGTFAFLLW